MKNRPHSGNSRGTSPGGADNEKRLMTDGRFPRHTRIYNLFPLLAGNVAAWYGHLPRIAAMQFDWVFVNPIQYPGFSGSIYAIKDHYRLNPLFRGAEEEGRSDDQVIADFVAEADRHGLAVMIDLVINHTSKDAVIAQQHPEWFERNERGELVSPFAVDPVEPQNPDKVTVWGDLASVDYRPRPEREALIRYWKDLVLHLAKLGIRGFRCDAAYKVPAEVWADIIRATREVHSEVWFFAENVGSFFEEVEALRPAGFDFLYNSAKWWDFRSPWLLEQYETFRHIAPSVAFPESHDTPRLAAEAAAAGISGSALVREMRRRYLFAAAFSTGVMIPIGFEYGFRRPLHVVDTRPDQWEEPAFDISADIAAVNAMKAACPPLGEEGPQRAVASMTGVVGLLRELRDRSQWALTVVNPPGNGAWTLETDGSDPLGALAAAGRDVTPAWADGSAPRSAGVIALDEGEIRIYAGERQAGTP